MGNILYGTITIDAKTIVIVLLAVALLGVFLWLIFDGRVIRKERRAKGGKSKALSFSDRTKREPDFYCHEHIIKSVVPNLDTMLTGLRPEPLQRHRIEMQKDREHKSLQFQNSSGTMIARIIQMDNGATGKEDIRLYRFRVEKCGNNGIENEAVSDAKTVITALEKAFVTLDFNALIECVD